MGKFGQQIRWDITRSVTLASVFYFLHHAAKACLLPFLTLHFRRLGLSGTQTGIITGSKAIIWFIAAPLWTVAAHRFGKTKIILGIAILCSIASNLSFTMVPPIDHESLVADCTISTLEVQPTDKNAMWHQDYSTIMSSTSATHTSTLPSTLQMEELNQVIDLFNTTNNDHFIDELNKLNNLTIIIINKTEVISEPPSTSTTTTESTTGSTTTKTTTTIASTTTTVASTPKVSTTTLAIIQPSKMASVLLPRILLAEPQSKSDIEDLLSEYDETKSWPRWKLRILTAKIIELLNQQPSKEETGALYEDDIQDIVNHLLPIYQGQKSRDHSLTLSKFLSNYAPIKVLPAKEQNDLRRYMSERLQEESSRNKRSLETDELERIINRTFSESLEHGIEDSSRLLIDTLKNNIFTFAVVLLIAIVGEIFSAPIDLLSDNSFHELLDELDSLNRFGRHKIAALVGGLLAGVSVAVAVYYSPCYLAGSISRFNIHFYAFATLAGLAFLVVPFYPVYVKRSNQARRSRAVTACPCCHVSLCADCRRLLLVFTIVLVGIVQAGVQDFLLWQIQSLPKSSELVYGSYVSAVAFSSLLAIPVGSKMTSVLRGAALVPMSLLVIASQLLLCSLINNAWFIVPLQLLNVLGVPFLWLVIASELKSMMSWNDEQTSLKVLDQVHVFTRSSQKRATFIAYLCLYQGLSFGIGSVVSGVAFDFSSGSLVPFLRIGALVIACWAGCYLLFHCCCIKKTNKRKYSKLLDDGSEDEVETFSLKDKKSDLGFSKKKFNGYLENGRVVAESRKKRRNKQTYDVTSSTDDELERDWMAMNARREDRF